MNQRPDLQSLSTSAWDVLVIGGGITGAGVAREAVRRGFRTLLLEQRDFAWGTSSRSSKMVHGGLRYIAAGDIRLTWHSLVERERLLQEAPGLVLRMGYWFAHYRRKFPGPLVFRLLLIIYDLLARVRDHSYSSKEAFLKIIPGYRAANLLGASRYTDALVDDARLVLRVLEEAAHEGAVVRNYTQVVDLFMEQGQVAGAVIKDAVTGEQQTLRAQVVISATGAWADQLRQPITGERKIRPLRGSHLVLSQERLPVKESVIFMHPRDNRAVFVYPWEGRTLAGTTDLDHQQDLNEEAAISKEEFAYLLQAVNSEFPEANIVAADVIATFSGVRPIVSSGKSNDPSSEKRDHSVFLDRGLVTVTGGKLTTFRQIAVDALKIASSLLGQPVREEKGPIFRPSPVQKDLPASLVARHGAQALEVQRLLQGKDREIIPGLNVFWGELRWSLRHEQVVHLDDLLLRRIRMGLLLPEGGKALLEKIIVMCKEELGWTQEQAHVEQQRYEQIWQKHYGTLAGADC